MKFRDFLQEQKEKHAVMAFGRMNPITSGHEKLVNKVKDVAREVGGSHHIVLSHSQDAKKNPLSAAQKSNMPNEPFLAQISRHLLENLQTFLHKPQTFIKEA
jgi:nicotinamide mononucleotide adenylyltransferase